MFSKADADASGGIDSKEFSTMVSISPMGRAAAAGGANTEEMFGKLDGNGDGSLTQAEMEDGMKKAMEFSNSSDPMSHAFSASRRSALITLSSSLALAACGGGGDDAATGLVRFINATSDAEPMGVSFDNDDRDEIRIFSAVPRNGQADDLAVGTGSYQLRLKRAGSSTTQAFGSITVDKNTAYSIVAYGRGA
jgi:hypothetical protein